MHSAISLTPVSEDWRAGGFGIYVHWPFCLAKCPYCDFNSHVARKVDHAAWRAALLSELKRYASTTRGRVVGSIFFGGGTPSLMEPDTVAAIVEAVGLHWQLAEDVEITLEANPTSVEAGRFRDFAKAGINRVSMGIQALNDEDLRRLGRMHSAREARQAHDIARQYFSRVSFDLIYARQFQSLERWRSELYEAISMAVDHLSLYQLTIESGTRFGDMYARGRLHGLPESELAADMYHATQEICEGAGMPGYEISNHARPGAESRHNLTYWRYGDYVGIGPGAHGRLTIAGSRFATEAVASPAGWLGAIASGGSAESDREALSGADQATEYALMSMRLHEGMSRSRFERLAGRAMDPRVLTELEEAGALSVSGDQIAATAEGRPILNHLLTKILS